ncbi:hypothetical protein N0V88_000364 [Collariella sp. IMI 366227]|nr:hypothetical protein N0V88_000364 [Collariella sp. IMI 366227]
MVSTTLCVGVIGMYHSGIGGGGFMLVRDKHGRYETIDYRETAPAAANQDMFEHDRNASVFGGLAVGIPGELRGLEYLHRKYGDLVRYMKAASIYNNTFLVDDPIWAEDFAPNAKSMIDFIQKMNGTMTLEDLEDYDVEVKPPLNVTYGDYRLFTTDAPSSGAVMLSTLKTMEQYPSEDLPHANLTTHRFVEAMKFAYGARLRLGDPDFVKNITQYQASLLTNTTASTIRHRIFDNHTQPIEAYDPLGLYTPDSHGTSHIVTTDQSGLTITSTTTINLLFGAQIMTPDTGIILNNEMDDFSQPGRHNAFGFAPSPSNFIRPRKRPLSSITPLIAEHASNNTLFFATGAAGGSRIISATTQVAWNMLAHGMGMHDAVAWPRVHHQLMPDVVRVEEGWDKSVVEGLRERGMRWSGWGLG